MTTSFYLHGGNTDAETPDNHFLFHDLSALNDAKNILVIYFAKPVGSWRAQFESDKVKFKATELRNVVLASLDMATLIQQLLDADVVFIRGGDTDQLLLIMKQVPDLLEKLENKVIIGSSAGALIFAKYYWANSKQNIQTGLGILPIKLFCHYTDDEADNFTFLEEYGDRNIAAIKVKSGCFVKYQIEGSEYHE